jgi:TolB protein
MRGKGGFAVRLLIATVCVCLLAPPVAQATFPGENGGIAFTRLAGDGGHDIHAIAADGSSLRQLTFTGDNFTPRWSANGRRIAFTSRRDGNFEIYVMDRDGGGQTRLTSDPGSDTYPTWSPDGRQIAFVRSTGFGPYEIYVMNADGTNQAKITSGSDPAWSPDGRKIAFIRGDVYTMNPDGTGSTALTDHGPWTRDRHYNPYTPNWSPDGEQVVYSLIFGGGPYFFYALQVVNSDGTNDRMVRFGIYNSEPGWSPDGRQIVFAENLSLATVPADAEGTPDFTPIPNTTSRDSGPDWQPLVSGPQREDYRNAAQYCKALQGFLGGFDFARRYKNLGQCVSRSHAAG